MPGYTGDPFARCFQPVVEKPRVPANPCVPTPCGPNSECRPVGEYPACTCIESYLGSPPNCRPECAINSECAFDKACMNLKCIDPCPGSCGFNTKCIVINHTPSCSCDEGYTGDPFQRCYPTPSKYKNQFLLKSNGSRYTDNLQRTSVTSAKQFINLCIEFDVKTSIFYTTNRYSRS